MPLLTQTVLDHRGRPAQVDSLGAIAAIYPVALIILLAVGCAISALVPHAITVGGTLLLVVMLFTSPLMLLAWQAALAPRQVSHRLIRRECPSCRYPLDGAVLQRDGCTVCPECAAAWRLDARTPP